VAAQLAASHEVFSSMSVCVIIKAVLNIRTVQCGSFGDLEAQQDLRPHVAGKWGTH
jgi:hypothetical protein